MQIVSDVQSNILLVKAHVLRANVALIYMLLLCKGTSEEIGIRLLSYMLLFILRRFSETIILNRTFAGCNIHMLAIRILVM